jgi:hypothetical protein
MFCGELNDADGADNIFVEGRHVNSVHLAVSQGC